MIDRAQISSMTGHFNNTGIAQHLSEIQAALVFQARKQLLGPDIEQRSNLDSMKVLLNQLGPAAAQCMMDEALIHFVKKEGGFKAISSQFTNNHVRNFQVIDKAFTANDNTVGVGECDNFANTLRQFILPRYAYIDMDMIVDPRHQIDMECGYPKWITPIMYRSMYDRDQYASRVVDIYPDESWSMDPDVFESDDENSSTAFEEDYTYFCQKFQLLSYWHRVDRICGIGHYGGLLMGLDDTDDLEKPVEEPGLLKPLSLKGSREIYVGKKQRELLYLRPFDEYLSYVQKYDTDVSSPRYGEPEIYNMVFLDMTVDAAGASIGTRLQRRVHWTRFIHVYDNPQTSRVFGQPRQQTVFNRLLDIRKILGGSGEMFWKGAFPGLSFEVDPRFVADNPDFDEDKWKREIDNYSLGLQRVLKTIGVKVNSLAPQVADPTPSIMVHLQSIAARKGIPLRILLGTEEGKTASAQSEQTWNRRLGRRNRHFVEPCIIRNTIDRLIAVGAWRPPQDLRKGYQTDWMDLNTATSEDSANLALKWTQALSQYVATGMIHFIGPVDYMTMILGLKPRDALRIDKYIQANGGYDKMRKVDPGQGAGVNGKRQNIAGQEKSPNQGGDKERDTNQKKTEGMTS